MTDLVTYERSGPVATVTMDDGKVNVFSIEMLRALHHALDRAEADGSVVLLTGRPGYFSAGFDLKVIRGAPEGVVEMLTLGATLAERIMGFGRPVLTACSGHCYPAGAFLLLSADLRLGVDGPFRIGLNEVRIGLTLPRFAVEIARQRLTPAAFDRTVVNATMFDPHQAVAAGFLDEVVDPGELAEAARRGAEDLAALDPAAHRAVKRRARGPALSALRQAIEADFPAAAGGG